MTAATEPEAAPVEAEALANARPAAEPELQAGPAATPELETQPVADAVAGDATGADDTDDASFGDLEPFVFEDFEQAEGARAATSQLFGEQGNKSVVPSDADLEALLAIEDEPFLDVEPEPEPELLAEATPEAAADAQPAAEDAAVAAEQLAEPDEFEQFLHSTLAATRALPAEQLPPSLAEEDLEPAARVDTLAATDSLYDRARAAKDQLVAEGVIRRSRVRVRVRTGS